AQDCGAVAFLAQAVTVLRHHHLTVHSSRTRFAGRLNSGVRPHTTFKELPDYLSVASSVTKIPSNGHLWP
ncbi:MAG: hypothetical protein ACSLEY_00260, partial [Candidatus Saccharimonadales bacterium]